MSNNYKMQNAGSAGAKTGSRMNAEGSGRKNVLMSVEVKTKKKQSDLALMDGKK